MPSKWQIKQPPQKGPSTCFFSHCSERLSSARKMAGIESTVRDVVQYEVVVARTTS